MQGSSFQKVSFNGKIKMWPWGLLSIEERQTVGKQAFPSLEIPNPGLLEREKGRT